MKYIFKLLISCVVVFIVGVWFGRDKSPIGGGFFILFLFLFLSILISWTFNTLYIKEYKYIYNKIYNKLDKIIIFNKYPNNKEKNAFRLIGYLFIPFFAGMIVKDICGGVETSTLFEKLGYMFGMFVIYKFSLKVFFGGYD